VASPVASDGNIYIVDEKGTVFVLRDGPGFRLIHEFPLNDNCLTAPAIKYGMIFFRIQKFMRAVGKN
jgi:hypothetical protein